MTQLIHNCSQAHSSWHGRCSYLQTQEINNYSHNKRMLHLWQQAPPQFNPVTSNHSSNSTSEQLHKMPDKLIAFPISLHLTSSRLIWHAPRLRSTSSRLNWCANSDDPQLQMSAPGLTDAPPRMHKRYHNNQQNPNAANPNLIHSVL